MVRTGGRALSEDSSSSVGACSSQPMHHHPALWGPGCSHCWTSSCVDALTLATCFVSSSRYAFPPRRSPRPLSAAQLSAVSLTRDDEGSFGSMCCSAAHLHHVKVAGITLLMPHNGSVSEHLGITRCCTKHIRHHLGIKDEDYSPEYGVFVRFGRVIGLKIKEEKEKVCNKATKVWSH